LTGKRIIRPTTTLRESSAPGGTMAHILDPHCICTDVEYRAARLELDELLGSDFDVPAGRRVDELIELIENYESSMRFVPDWSDESFRHAA
jgi:hypothetical protein